MGVVRLITDSDVEGKQATRARGVANSSWLLDLPGMVEYYSTLNNTMRNRQHHGMRTPTANLLKNSTRFLRSIIS